MNDYDTLACETGKRRQQAFIVTSDTPLEEPSQELPQEPHKAGTTPFCYATIVVDKALESLLSSGADARLKDEHPWLVAERDVYQAQLAGLNVPVLLAKQSQTVHDCVFSHWAFIKSVEVLELSGKRYRTEVELGALTEVSPLFTELDSVQLKPSDEQLLREEVESIRTQRVALQEQYLRPYAICESPGFIPRLTPWLYPRLED